MKKKQLKKEIKNIYQGIEIILAKIEDMESDIYELQEYQTSCDKQLKEQANLLKSLKEKVECIEFVLD